MEIKTEVTLTASETSEFYPFASW